MHWVQSWFRVSLFTNNQYCCQVARSVPRLCQQPLPLQRYPESVLQSVNSTGEHLWVFTCILCASLGTGIEVLCNVRSCLLLWTSHTSSITDKEQVVHTAKRWSCDQERGCSPLTGVWSGTTGSRLTTTSSALEGRPSSGCASALITTLLGSECTVTDGPVAAMFLCVEEVTSLGVGAEGGTSS